MTVSAITSEYGYTYLQCDCSRTEIRYRVMSNGVGIYAQQCMDCGRQIRAVAKQSPEVRQLAERVPFDPSIQERWQAQQRALSEKRISEQEMRQQQEKAAWWSDYSAYLRTPAWRAKRAKVLARASGMCEGCGERYATQVHHKTYDHVGNELLFELVAVCDACHHILHPDMDERQ